MINYGRPERRELSCIPGFRVEIDDNRPISEAQNAMQRALHKI
jgi:hypothetical protein